MPGLGGEQGLQALCLGPAPVLALTDVQPRPGSGWAGVGLGPQGEPCVLTTLKEGAVGASRARSTPAGEEAASPRSRALSRPFTLCAETRPSGAERGSAREAGGLVSQSGQDVLSVTALWPCSSWVPRPDDSLCPLLPPAALLGGSGSRAGLAWVALRRLSPARL